jgi:hypothetical protein
MQAVGMTPQEIERAGLLAIQALQGRKVLFWRLQPNHETLKTSLHDLIEVAYEADLTTASDEQMQDIDVRLANVIASLDRFITERLTDVREVRAFCDIAERLRTVQYWFDRGLSPNPNKRPSKAQLDQMASERASETVRELLGISE